jgi:hypothetical protein
LLSFVVISFGASTTCLLIFAKPSLFIHFFITNLVISDLYRINNSAALVKPFVAANLLGVVREIVKHSPPPLHTTTAEQALAADQNGNKDGDGGGSGDDSGGGGGGGSGSSSGVSGSGGGGSGSDKRVHTRSFSDVVSDGGGEGGGGGGSGSGGSGSGSKRVYTRSFSDVVMSLLEKDPANRPSAAGRWNHVRGYSHYLIVFAYFNRYFSFR